MSNEHDLRKRPKAQTPERIRRCIDVDDYKKLFDREEGADWPLLCKDLADADRQYAEEQLALGRKGTAKYFYGAASYLYELGQYGFTDLVEEKLSLYKNHVECTEKYGRLGMELGQYHWDKVEIPYKGYEMDGYMITPVKMRSQNPILLVIPGATEFKDNFIKNFEPIVARGMAVLIVDGPGQGTTRFFRNGCLEVEVEKAYSKMIDYIEADGRFGKISVMGISTGGYYVPRVAGRDKRIAGCIINGGTYYPEEILNNFPGYRHKFAVLFGMTDEEIDSILPTMTLEGFAEEIHCPLLILHGEEDPIFPVGSARKIYDVAKSKDKTFISYPNAFHCCGGEISKAWHLLNDWLCEHFL